MYSAFDAAAAAAASCYTSCMSYLLVRPCSLQKHVRIVLNLLRFPESILGVDSRPCHTGDASTPDASVPRSFSVCVSHSSAACLKTHDIVHVRFLQLTCVCKLLRERDCCSFILFQIFRA